MIEYKILDSIRGYVNKKDITNLQPNYLVSPSKNVLINDGEKIQKRLGFSLYGAANSALTPIEASYTWNTSTGTEIPLRAYDDELEYYYSGSWRRLAASWTSVEFNFTTWWDNTEKLDKLIFVNGTPNLYSWSGGIATFASATVNTITKQGTETWGESRFLTSGTRQVIINGTTYTYTGGESTTTLTGVTPDPTLAGHAVGSVVVQAIITTANKPASGFNNVIVDVLNNQIYVADDQKRQVYISKNSDFTDFAFSSPRVPGEGALMNPDSPPVGFIAQEDKMYVTAGFNEWYEIKFELSADLTKETVKINRLKTAPLSAAVSQSAVAKIKNDVVFISQEPTLDTLGRQTNDSNVQSLPVSDPIKLDFDTYDFRTIKPHVIYYRNWVLIAVPASGVVLIYDVEKKFWQPPWYMSISRFTIIDGELYGHSASVAETYKLLDTYNDNDTPIEAIAAFAYRNFGKRANLKSFDQYYTEGYISIGTTLDITIKYDFGGFRSIVSKQIDSTNSNLIFQTIADNSLGKTPFGSNPLGSVVDSPSNLPKFRVKHELQKQDFYEYQVVYSTNDLDYQWEILAHGSNTYQSGNRDQDIII